MIHLVSHHKIRDSLSYEAEAKGAQKIRFKSSEDTLTSCVFSLLSYLPSPMMWEIILEACYQQHLPKECGKLLSIDFWPHWNPSGTSNNRFNEPDVFLRFEQFDLLVEAKKGDKDDQQSKNQHERELQSYFNEYGADNKTVLFLAIGGHRYLATNLQPVNIEGKEPIEIAAVRWQELYFYVNKQLQQLNHKPTFNSEEVSFILKDLLLSFMLHGYFIGDYLETLQNNVRFNYHYFPKL